MKKVFEYTYSIIIYIMFLGIFFYTIGFVGNFMVPKSIDSGVERGLSITLFVNILLLGLFAIQHSVMARPAFKELWTKIIPETIERTTYVLATNLCLILLFYLWIPMKGFVWNFQGTFLAGILWALFATGCLIISISTFLINHFELFGLRQTYYSLVNKETPPVSFNKNGLYQFCRHPMMLGFIITLFATPTMTFGHLFFAIIVTGYIFIALIFEERDLVNLIGEDYKQYQKDVPKICPFSFRKKAMPKEENSPLEAYRE